ncbi:MAG: hypothetical protein ACD_73C00550G0001, partial [uncultured bacterium]
IMGTERHESRRIDNQLRGRAGRQGDPGSSRFYVSLEDDLMRIFGSERIAKVMETLGMTEDENIEHRWISKAIENAQKKVESHNFDIRKTVLEYDDVMNQQRVTIYAKRREIMDGKDIHEKMLDMVDAVADSISQQFAGDAENVGGLKEKVGQQFGIPIDFADIPQEFKADDIGQKIYDEVIRFYEKKELELGSEIMRQVERYFMLQTLDTLWKDHLLAMDHLREGIGLRGYGQKDPKMEYKKEGFALFGSMIQAYYEDTLEKLFKVQIQKGQEVPQERRRVQPMQLEKRDIVPVQHPEGSHTGSHENPPEPQKVVTQQRQYPKVGRNDDCPCGSGKKYKKCHGS